MDQDVLGNFDVQLVLDCSTPNISGNVSFKKICPLCVSLDLSGQRLEKDLHAS